MDHSVLREHFNMIITFCIIEFPLFSLSEHDDDPEQNHLHHSSHQGNLSGVETEPADRVVVEDVDDVGDQDQHHSSAEVPPTRNTQTGPFKIRDEV